VIHLNETSKSPPEWAHEFARGALVSGLKVPEIEQHLVARGLTPDEANSLVMGILAGNVQQRTRALARSERAKPIRLFVSAAIGGACMLLAYGFGGGPSVGRSLIWLVPVLGGIWLPELTDTEDSDWGQRSVVTGWLLLVLYFGYRIFLWVTIH
jgi:hypothetical protein